MTKRIVALVLSLALVMGLMPSNIVLSAELEKIVLDFSDVEEKGYAIEGIEGKEKIKIYYNDIKESECTFIVDTSQNILPKYVLTDIEGNVVATTVASVAEQGQVVIKQSGTYRVTVSAEEYESTSFIIEAGVLEIFEVSDNILEYQDKYNDKKFVIPIEMAEDGFELLAEIPESTTYTINNGDEKKAEKLSFNEIGQYNILVKAEGFESVTYQVVVREWQNIELSNAIKQYQNEESANEFIIPYDEASSGIKLLGNNVPSDVSVIIKDSTGDDVTSSVYDNNTQTIRNLSSGEYTVEISALYYYDASYTIVVNSHRFELSEDISLYANENTITIPNNLSNVKLLLGDLTGVTYTVKDNTGKNVNNYITANGRLNFSKEGTYTISVLKQDYMPQTYTINVLKAISPTVVTNSKQVTFQKKQGKNITTISYSDAKKGICFYDLDTNVTVNPQMNYSTNGHYYYFEPTETKTYTIKMTGEGYYTEVYEITISEGKIIYEVNKSELDYDTAKDSGYTIKSQQATSYKVLKGTEEVVKGNFVNGQAVIKLTGAGRYTLQLSANNYATATCELVVVPTQEDIILKKEGDIDLNNNCIEGDYHNLIKKNIKFVGSADVKDMDNSEIVYIYESSDENVATVENGKVTIKSIGNVDITVMAVDNKGNYEFAEKKYTITIKQSNLYVKIYAINEDGSFTEITGQRYIINESEIDDEDMLELPIMVKIYNKVQGKEYECTYPSFKYSYKLKIDTEAPTITTNATNQNITPVLNKCDEIVRLQDYEVIVEIEDTVGNSTITANKFLLYIDGDNSDEIVEGKRKNYNVDTVVKAKDGWHYWSQLSKVAITPLDKNVKISKDDRSDNFSKLPSKLVYDETDNDHAIKEHKFYIISEQEEIIKYSAPYREYFGVDTAKPAVFANIDTTTEFNKTEGIITKDKVTISAIVMDTNLYSVQLVNRANGIEENLTGKIDISDKTDATVTITLDPIDNQVLIYDIYIIAEDKAGNRTEKPLMKAYYDNHSMELMTSDELVGEYVEVTTINNTVMIDRVLPIGTIVLNETGVIKRSVGDALVNFSKSNVNYDIVLSDEGSGIASASVAHNGIQVWNSTLSGTYSVTDSNKNVEISFIEIVDKAGNKGLLTSKSIVHIDKSPPSGYFYFDGTNNKLDSKDRYFYNSPVVLKWESNDGIGVGGAEIFLVETIVDEAGNEKENLIPFADADSDNKKTFNIGDSYMNETLVIMDDLENRQQINLAECIIVEKTEPKVAITVEPLPNDAGWYKENPTISIATYEQGDVQSGIKNVKVWLNGTVHEYDVEKITGSQYVSEWIIPEELFKNTLWQEGINDIRVEVEDNSGNRALPEDNNRQFKLDTKNPKLESFKVYDQDKLEVSWNGTEYIGKESLIFEFDVEGEGSGFKSAVLGVGKDEATVTEFEYDKDNGKLTFVIPADIEGNVYLKMTDVADNDTGYVLLEELEIDDGKVTVPGSYIIVEDNAPTVTLDLGAPDKDVWHNGESVDVTITVADSSETATISSGINTVVLKINGKEFKKYVMSDMPTEELTIVNGKVVKVVHTETIELKDLNDIDAYDVNGEYVFTLVAEDNAVNNNVESDSAKTEYIDFETPKVTGIVFASEDKLNLGEKGNYANNKLTLDISWEERGGSDVESVSLKLGELELTEKYVQGEKLTFEIPVDNNGEMSLSIVDIAGNVAEFVPVTQVEKLEVTEKETQETKEIKLNSNIFIVENIPVDVDITIDNIADITLWNDKWYNKEVVFSVQTNEKPNASDLASGIKKITTYVNDTKIAENEYAFGEAEGSNNTITHNYLVPINQSRIEELINDAGSYTIKVEIEDYAGNITTLNREMTVHIDTVKPIIMPITGVNKYSNMGSITLGFEVLEKHYAELGNKATINVTRELDGVVDSFVIPDFVPNAMPAQFERLFTQDGHYTVSIDYVDAANWSAKTQEITFEIDNTAPQINLSGVSQDAYSNVPVTLGVTVTESNYDRNSVTVTATRNLNGNVVEIPLSAFTSSAKSSTNRYAFAEEGTYTVTVNATDEAGNPATESTITFTVDNADPEIIISGIADGSAYNSAVLPVIEISDNYFDSYSVSLVKNGISFDETNLVVKGTKAENVTDKYTKAMTTDKNGGSVQYDTFAETKENDGIYTLTVSATDKAGRTAQKQVVFTVNRFGSVYTMNDSLSNIIDAYTTAVTEDLVITEYNANSLRDDSVKLQITRDGSPLESVSYTVTPEISTNNTIGESGWYQYNYVIDKSNFEKDGVYMITLSSKDQAGNVSETNEYDSMSMYFSVDTEKPEINMINGLSEKSYNAESIDVSYKVFDTIGIENITVYVGSEIVQQIEEFEDMTSYEGVFTVNEGAEQQVRFVVEDKAGNVIDTEEDDDYKSDKVANFQRTITVSTKFWVRFMANKTAFYGTIAGTIVAAIGVIFIILFKKKRKEAK